MRKLRIFNALFLFCCFFLLIFTLSCSRDATKPPLSPTPTETHLEIKRLDITETPTINQLVRVMPQLDAECMRLQLLGHDYASFLRQEIPENLGGFPNKAAVECFSNETFSILTISKLELEAGKLSDQSASCIIQTMAGFDFSSIYKQSSLEQEAAFETSIALLLCLSQKEAQRIALISIFGEEASLPEGSTLDDLRCLFENSDLQSLQSSQSTQNFGDTFKADHLKVLADCMKVR